MRLNALLTQELCRRRRVNAAYSLRAFAVSLEVHHATLLRLLRGDMRGSPRTVQRVGRKLGLDAAERARLRAAEQQAAVVEAIQRHDFRPSSRWVASVAGVPMDDVNVALQALLVEGRLTMADRSLWHIQPQARKDAA